MFILFSLVTNGLNIRIFVCMSIFMYWSAIVEIWSVGYRFDQEKTGFSFKYSHCKCSIAIIDL